MMSAKDEREFKSLIREVIDACIDTSEMTLHDVLACLAEQIFELQAEAAAEDAG